MPMLYFDPFPDGAPLSVGVAMVLLIWLAILALAIRQEYKWLKKKCD